MQRDDIRPNQIDWVFCWRTSTGDVRPGARDATFNGKPVRYQPSGTGSGRGLRTIVHGRVRTCPLPPTGPRLDQQGAISRMCMFVSGYVDSAALVPARTEAELAILRDYARAAVRTGDASSWALAAFRARGEVRWAIHLGAALAVVSDAAERVDAPWTLDIREKPAGTWVKGAQIFCRDRDGGVLAILEADSIFDNALLPAFASTEHTGGSPEGGGVVEIGWPHPAGPDAWERWVKAEKEEAS